jgi:16S rRNA (cytidine1402-2'-O)-methyltransferase
LEQGDVALISDAGTPAISDPGADLVRAALEAGYRVSPIPGPSALAAAVSVSGLVDGPFLSLGFLPRQRGERRNVIARAAASGTPFVIFESANRVAHTIGDLLGSLGDRQAAAMRELTKFHEEVRIGTLAELRAWVESGTARGEFVLVIGGGEEAVASSVDAQEIVERLRRAGLSASQTAREAAAVTGRSRAELYRMAMASAAERSVRLEGELPLSNEDALQDPLGDQEGPERRQARTDKR